MDSLHWIQQFHLIRPYWLLALFPLALIIWLSARTQIHSHSWASVIDKRLLPHLLQEKNVHKKNKNMLTLFIPLFVLGAIIIFALAGPAFEKRPQPIFKAQSPLVIILDLSRSMDAADIKPSRLARAHFKINDILKMRKEGQTALIVYAGDAFVVSPLTDDAQTIASQISALDTYIMPTQGSRLDIALNKAKQLLNNAGHYKGDILVVTDSINSNAKNTLKALSENDIKTSILAVGTVEGAPIATQNGGFVKDNNGAIVIPKLDINNLKSAAISGGGNFSLLTPTDEDIRYLLSNIKIDREKPDNIDAAKNKFKTDIWHEEGPWLILFVIPFAAYAFRKGLIFALLIFILPLPQPAQAFGWSDLWNNNNQQASKALEKGDAQQAAELFNNPEWKAAAQYKAGEYQQAAELLSNIDTADANYNRGNALAKANDLDAAIEAYDRALELNPDLEDAAYNKRLLVNAKKEQQNQAKNDNNKDSEKKNKKDNENKDKKGNDKNKDEGDKKFSNNSQKEGSNQDASEENNGENSGEESDKKADKQEDSANDQQNADGSKDENQADKKDAKEQQAKDSAEDKKSEEKQSASDEENKDGTEEEKRKARQKQLSDETPDLEQQQTQQWLKKIPDDPGGLLRRKFRYQYSKQSQQNNEDPW